MSKLIREKDLTAAIELVKAEIGAVKAELEEATTLEEQDPIMIEGETYTGYYCRLMVDPKDAAAIALEYHYAESKVLGEDYEDGMWQELADHYGLKTVTSIDL